MEEQNKSMSAERVPDETPAAQTAADTTSEKRKRHIGLTAAILALLALVCLGWVWVHRLELTTRRSYEITSTSEVTFGRDGQTLLIDNGKKTLLVLDADGTLVSRYDGGSDAAPFYYACHAAQAADGSIYVAEIRYGTRGNLLDRERIVRLNGTEHTVIWEADYTKWDITQTPLQYGRILELQLYGDSLFFLLDTGNAVELRRINEAGIAALVASVPAEGMKNSASYDAETRQLAVINRSGALTVWSLSDHAEQTVQTAAGGMPYDITVRGGEAYYTDLLRRCAVHFSLSDPTAQEVFAALDEIPFQLDVSGDGHSVLITDQVGFYRCDGAAPVYADSAPYSNPARFALTWALLLIGALCALALLCIIAAAIFRAAAKRENALRVLLIIAASLLVSFVLTFTLLTRLFGDNTAASEKQLALFSDLMHAEIDTDALCALDDPSDHDSAAFRALKEPLDAHTWDSYRRGDYYYYILYRAIGGNVVMVMDFEDTMPCAKPMYPDDPEGNDYAPVLHTGDPLQISEISAYGAWSFLVTPIRDDGGEIVGALEVGQSLDALQKQQALLRRELIIGIVTSTIVITMLMLEVAFLLTYFQIRRSLKKPDNTQLVPLRTIMFLIYLADSMQDAFIAILCSQLYQGQLPLPVSVAIALPMSAQLLTMALFSLFAGRLVERFGSRVVMTAGMLVFLSGFLVCMLLGSYSGLLIGKLLIGAGMGTVYVSCNAVAATGGSIPLIADANAAISAGTLAGLTIGAGLASVLLSMGSWRLIYLVGAVIAGCGLLLSALSGNVQMGREKTDFSMEKIISRQEFFRSRRVIGFFLLILVPFMMALSYREFFFPLFAQEHGIDEVRIGQIYLACGMLTLYIGPVLSAWILKKLGAFWSIAAASGALALDMLLFVLFPGLWTVIAGVVLLSLIISFAYTCQYTYYELTPEIMLFGEGRAVGIYSVFESIGQTVGPVAYGALLTLGYRQGIGSFSIIMLAFLLIFVTIMLPYRKPYKD